MNQHTKKFCNKYDITEKQYYGKEWINGSLIINEDKIPQGFNPKIRYSLSLDNVKKILRNFSPIIGGNLSLDNLEKISENFNPVIAGSLYLYKLKELPSNFSLIIGNSLFLKNLEKLPENFNFIIGGSLFLNLKELPDNFNPVVRRKINYNLITVFNANNFEYTSEYISTNKPPSLLSWKNEKYIMVDGFFSEVICKKGKIYKVKDICSGYIGGGYDREVFLVTDGKGTYAHGSTIKKAKEDLLFKIDKNKNLDSFKSLKLDSKISYKNAIECYRLITGACEYGTKKFIETNNIKNKDYTIKEIIKITKNQYRNDEFKQFFNN